MVMDQFKEAELKISERQRKENNEEVEISEIRVSLHDNLTQLFISKPVRGRNCKHPNSFSLEPFLITVKRQNTRRWMCPVCKMRSHQLVFDSYLEEILEAAKQLPVMPEFIYYQKDGSYTFTERGKAD
jgi:hypothetical protein